MVSAKNDGYTSPFAKRLRAVLEETNTTQQVLADKLGIKRQTVSNYCNGNAQPNLERLVEISKYFNVPTDYLLGKVDAKTPDITIRQICEYTGLSEDVVNKLWGIKNGADMEFISILSRVLEHGNFVKLLGAIQSHVLNFNRDFYTNNTEIEKHLAGVFQCRPEESREYMEATSRLVIESAIMKIVDDIE